MNKPITFGEKGYGTKFTYTDKDGFGVFMKVIPLEIEGEMINAIGMNTFYGRLRRVCIESSTPINVIN